MRRNLGDYDGEDCAFIVAVKVINARDEFGFSVYEVWCSGGTIPWFETCHTLQAPASANDLGCSPVSVDGAP